MKKIEISKKIFFQLPYTIKGFVIPNYQRNYSWKTDSIDFLFEEFEEFYNALNLNITKWGKNNDDGILIGTPSNIFVDESLDKNIPSIFLGNLVIMQSKISTPAQVIDGQQRLTSILLILKAITLLRPKAINKLPAPYSTVNTLLKEIVEQTDKIGEPLPFVKSMNINDESELEAIFSSSTYDLLMKKLDGRKLFHKNLIHIEAKLTDKDDDYIMKIVIAILTTEVGLLVVENESMAFDLFEKLNSRGMQLSQSDLVKNLYFKHLSSDKEYQHVSKWDGAIAKLQDEQKIVNPGHITDFIRWILMIETNSYIVKKEVFKEVSNKVKDMDQAKTSLDKLVAFADMWNDYFLNPSSTFEDENIKIIERAFNSSPKIYKPIYLKLALLHMEEDGITDTYFIKCIEYLEKQSFLHFTINNLPSKEIDGKMGEILTEIDKDNSKIIEVFDMLIKPETIKKQGYSDLVLPLLTMDFDKRKQNLQLHNIIRQFRYSSDEEYKALKQSNLHLEHLLPQDPKLWIKNKDITTQEHKDTYAKIGNLFFISGNINTKIKNHVYTKKYNSKDYITQKHDKKLKSSLSDSPLFKDSMKLAFKDIPEVWSADHIKSRTRFIVKFLIKNNVLNPWKQIDFTEDDIDKNIDTYIKKASEEA